MDREDQKDELLQECLIKAEIQWKFNLSRASWWGGQFEQMVGFVGFVGFEVTLNNRDL